MGTRERFHLPFSSLQGIVSGTSTINTFALALIIAETCLLWALAILVVFLVRKQTQIMHKLDEKRQTRRPARTVSDNDTR